MAHTLLLKRAEYCDSYLQNVVQIHLTCGFLARTGPSTVIEITVCSSEISNAKKGNSGCGFIKIAVSRGDRQNQEFNFANLGEILKI